MNLDLTGKTAVVCGSTQGLGWASAVELAKLGATIVLVARNEKSLKASAQKLPADHQQEHTYLVADFSKAAEVQSVIYKFVTDGGVADILINNTGGPPGGAILDASAEAFMQALESHLLCNHFLVQGLVPGMKAKKWGRVINVISTSVKIPIAGLGVSNTTRAAVANWSKTLAGELAPFGITVNNVLPGFTNTSRATYVIDKKAVSQNKSAAEVMNDLVAEIPVGRIGEPEEFGAAVAFLSSPAAGYITGINLPVDGGRLGCL